MDSKHRIALGRNVKRLREARGWSQMMMAQRTGVSQAALSYIERRDTKSPSLDTIEQISKVFSIPTWAMLLDISSLSTSEVKELDALVECFLCCPADSREQITRTAKREAEYAAAKKNP